jgi:hypothetical protein
LRGSAAWALGFALVTVIASALAGCASAPPKLAAQPPALSPPPLAASYDWHVLVAAPFGTVLRDMPLALHEVLLFRDDEKRSSETEEPECYASNSEAPRFVSRIPDEYLLCFLHDRLARIEGTVRVPREEAAKVFADACGLWLKNVVAAPSALAQTGYTPPTEASPGACEGNDGVAAFSARLETEADQADAVLSIKLAAQLTEAPVSPSGQR